MGKFHSSEEENGGSVQYHSSEDDDDSEEDGGSMEMHPDIDNNENWFDSDENEQDTDDDDAGSVQLNDVENNEQWVDDEFDTQSIEYKGSDNDDEELQIYLGMVDADNENVDTQNHAFSPSLNEYELERQDSTRNKRLAAMKNANDGGLDGLKLKYQKERRNREQMSEVDAPWTLNDLIKPGDDEEDEIQVENKNDADYDALIESDEDDVDIIYGSQQPQQQRRSVLLDINQLSMTLAAVVEEDDDEDDNEKCFQMKTYETDSDCDSNDSVVVKKEIVTNVTSDALNDLQKDSLSIV